MLSKLPDRKILSETVMEKLRAVILGGEISPGTRLVARVLAEKMGVSRTPVHEALNGLVAEKLVKRTLNNGFVVASIEKKDIVQLYTIRLHLETLAIQWVLPNLAPKVIDRLKKNVARLEKYVLKADVKGIIETNVQFHQILVSAAQSNILADFVELLQRNARLFRIHSVSLSGRPAQVVAEHKAIVEALEKRDETEAVACMKSHLNNALNSLLFSLSVCEESEVA